MTRPISAIVERLRDSLGDGSIDDYYVRFFIGDIRAVVERLDACERVVEAARAFVSVMGADSMALTSPQERRFDDLDEAVLALDAEEAER